MIYNDHGHLVADSMDDLTKEGWNPLLNVPYKAGVRLVHATRPTFGINPDFHVFYVGDAAVTQEVVDAHRKAEAEAHAKAHQCT
jgi:hypothetical protein